MSCVLTSGRKTACKDTLGGIKDVLFGKFEVYDHTQAVVNDGELTAFPDVSFFQYEHVTANFSEQINNTPEGISYDQTLVVRYLPIINEGKDFFILNPLRIVDVRAIITDNNGKIKMGGFENGLRLTSYSRGTGAAHGDFTGYEMTFTGRETRPAPYMPIIEVPDIEFIENFFFEDKNNFLFQDGVNFIWQ